MKQSTFSKSGYICHINCMPSEKGRWIYLCTITYPVSGPYDDEARFDSDRAYASEKEAKHPGCGTFLDILTSRIISVIRDICHADQE